ncbi:hypothetical protein [Sulfurimonas sp.]|jgi:hypothetical protein|uniref:hypothetical protein n=1 Tax=Sulfurimonas sp. TaxID=2022749 RepID=UPI002A3691CA|nr:hypothetical protein [Sulfurimonas sp.]MDY0123870.1 hypothetical protein [Sulfurimonas sp.]
MPVFDFASVARAIWYFIKKAAYGSVVFTFLGIVIAGFVTFVATFFVFYNLLDDSITRIMVYGSGDLLSKFFGLLNCIGFTSAFNDTKGYLFGGLVFLLLRIVSAQVIRSYYILLRVISPLVQS